MMYHVNGEQCLDCVELPPDRAPQLGILRGTRGALATLPDKFQRVVQLVDVDGLSYAEAAGCWVSRWAP